MKLGRAAILLPLAVSLCSAPAGAQGGVEVTPLQAPAPPPAAAPAPAAPMRDSAAAERDAETSYSQGRLDDAVAQYEEAARLQSAPAERVRLLVVVSALQHRLGRNDAAIDAMTRALAIDPAYALSQDNFTPTFQDIYYEGRKRALEQRAATARESVHTGDDRMHARDYTGARAAYRDALAIDPTLVNALFGLAEVDREQGNREAALAGYQKLLALRRGSPDALSSSLQVAALNTVGILYYDKGFYEDAESALAEAAQLDAKSAETWTNLGLARRKLGKRKEASEALRRAYTLDPENEAAASNLALTYLDGSNWIEAVSLLLEATRKSPENPQLWLNLGIAQQGMDNLDGAIGSFVKARDLDPDNRHGFAALAAGYLAPAYA
jgi:tetratricopeptide (TPR) repeat protein